MRKFTFLAFLCVVTHTFGAFGYYSPVSINSGQVPSTQTDFPVLVSVTDARFKTVANGGHVQNASGFDVRPVSDTVLTTITGYELERYNASTGEVVMWVKVGSVTSSSTPIYLAYGDASLTTDGSSTTTWSNHFKIVCHVKDGTTLNVSDSANSVTTVNHGATATAGKIDGGAAFASASSQYIDLTNNVNPTAITYSAWVNATSFPNSVNAVISRVTVGAYSAIQVNSTGKLACYVVANADVHYDGTGSHTLSSGTSYLLHMVYSSAVGLIGYVNAASDGTGAANGNLNTTATLTDVGKDPQNAGRFWNGGLDEIRVSDIARTADWITTEYNNQSAPGTFETLGTEVTIGPVISPNRVSNFFFSD